jgi:hypothetical protein
VVAKLSKFERSFIKELRISSIPKILRVVPPSSSEEIKSVDFYSINYMFEFADMIKLNIGCPLGIQNLDGKSFQKMQ